MRHLKFILILIPFAFLLILAGLCPLNSPLGEKSNWWQRLGQWAYNKSRDLERWSLE